MDDELRGPVAQAAREAWRRFLKVAQVGDTDDFFELGGHSVSAMRVTLVLRRTFGCKVGIDTLLDNPQFSDFVDRLVDELARRPVSATPSTRGMST